MSNVIMGYGSGRYTNGAGYVLVMSKGHPRADRDGYIYEHVAVAERVLGAFLPPMAQVHHVNKNRGDNRTSNLVICEDYAFHSLLHARLRALKNGGSVAAKRCVFCKLWGTDGIRVTARGKNYHPVCNARYEANRKNTALA